MHVALNLDIDYFQEKLALLTAQHDPYHCSSCGISAPDKMKFCSKCDLARYCSRKCQIKDWETSHRLSCHEIVSLRHSILRVSEECEDQKVLLTMKSRGDLRVKRALLGARHFPNYCSNCVINVPDKVCSKCEVARYCSRECQIEHWKTTHRIFCPEMVSVKNTLSYIDDQFLKMKKDLNEEMERIQRWKEYNDGKNAND